MTIKNEPNYLGDVLKWEAENRYSRDAVTVLSGQNLAVGTVVGKARIGTITGAAAAGNTGDGTMGAVTAGNGIQVGVYQVTFIEPAANLGTFQVEDPDGAVIGTGVVASAFAGKINFTIADGGADFVAGDRFTVTVAEGTGKVKASPDVAADGSEVAVGILMAAVDATAADKAGVIISRQAVVSEQGLVYDSTVDDAAKRAAKKVQLEAAGIQFREGA